MVRIAETTETLTFLQLHETPEHSNTHRLFDGTQHRFSNLKWLQLLLCIILFFFNSNSTVQDFWHQ